MLVIFNNGDNMNLYESIKSQKSTMSVIGLGYVGIPLAIAFGKRLNLIGFDISKSKIEQYRKGIDPTREVGNEEIRKSNILFTTDEKKLKEAVFHIIAVPTPINSDKSPDLSPLKNASRILGRNLSRGSIVVFESTVYPGVTEEICIPILEKESGFKCGVDFKVGYSPERINPGDNTHRLENIVKVVSAIDEETLDLVAKIYEIVVKAGVYKAGSIRIAEAAKVIENSQRDINIAFMNELSMIFDKLNIDTKAVLEAAGTKWNFLNFEPGLVGGHCIGVDPYYLTYLAKQLGYNSQIILSGRLINDKMAKYVAKKILIMLKRSNIDIKEPKVAILGFTFKEDCPDTRNSKVIDIVRELNKSGVSTYVTDPAGDAFETNDEDNINFVDINIIKNMDVVVIAVKHKEYLNLTEPLIRKLYKNSQNDKKILIDLKGILNRKEYEDLGYIYWRL